MTATATRRETDKPARKGFDGIRCPLCGTEDAQLVGLNDLTEFRCSSCEETYTLDDVRQLLRSWERVISWIEAELAAE